MPKPAAHALIWSAEKRCYLLHSPDHLPLPILPGDEGAWQAWLTTHSSFSFQGQHDRLNMLKEFRPRGTGYWYAYRMPNSFRIARLVASPGKDFCESVQRSSFDGTS